MEWVLWNIEGVGGWVLWTNEWKRVMVVGTCVLVEQIEGDGMVGAVGYGRWERMG